MTNIQPVFGAHPKPASPAFGQRNVFAASPAKPADSVSIRFGGKRKGQPAGTDQTVKVDVPDRSGLSDKDFTATLPASYQLAITGAQLIAQDVGEPVTVDKILLSMLDLINQHFAELTTPKDAGEQDSAQVSQVREIYEAIFPPSKFEGTSPTAIQLMLGHARQMLMEDIHRGAGNNGNIKRTRPENIRFEETTRNFLDYVTSLAPDALKGEEPAAQDFITYLGLKATEEKADRIPDEFKTANVVLDELLNTPVVQVPGKQPAPMPDITAIAGGNSELSAEEGGDAASLNEPGAENKLLPVLYKPGKDTPLLLSEELEDVLGKVKFVSPVAGQWLVSAINVAGAANAQELEPKHLALAMVRAANALIEAKPEFVNAALDTLPISSADSPQPFRAQRTTLDALIPPQYRQGMSVPQVQALLNSATANLEAEIYEDSSTFTDVTDDIVLSPELNKIFSQLILASPATGRYPYALGDMLRASADSDFGEGTTGQILKNLYDNAEKKSGSVPNVKLSDIGGYKNEKEELQEFIDLHTNPEMAEALGGTKDIPRGLMFYGPTGTGKTFMAKALANALGLPFYAYNGSDFVEKYVGVGAKRVREMFKEARKHKGGAVIFIDEIDALLKKRGEATGDTETARTVNAFLAEMDGVLESNPNVILVGATNLLGSIDEAALRPGRFDRKMEIKSPDKDDRREILDVVFKNKPVADDVNFENLARITAGKAGADLDNLASESHLRALRMLNKGQRDNLEITAQDIDEALDRIDMGPPSLRNYSDEMLRLVANHEVLGHGIVGYALGMEPRTVTTIGRGDSLGHVMFIPQDGRHHTIRYQLEQLVMGMAGAAAEEVTLGGKAEISTGPRGDMESARAKIKMAISSGQLPGFKANQYNTLDDKLSAEDEKLMNYLIERSQETAAKMIDVIPKAKQKDIENECMKRIELRNEDAVNFFASRFTDKELADMKAIFDDYVNEMVGVLHSKANENQKKFLGKNIGEKGKGIAGFFRNIASRIVDFFRKLFSVPTKTTEA